MREFVFSEVADRLRSEWGDRSSVQLLVHESAEYLRHYTRNKMLLPGGDAWKGTAVYKCGPLKFLPLESQQSRGNYQILEETVRQEESALQLLVDAANSCSELLQCRITDFDETCDPDSFSFQDTWTQSDTIWPQLLKWFHDNGRDLQVSGIPHSCMMRLIIRLLRSVTSEDLAPPDPAGDSDKYLRASDPEAHRFQDGSQWCDVQYARTLSITPQQLSRAFNSDKGCYEVRLTERKRADIPGKPFVYLRAELNELADAISANHAHPRD